MGRKRWWILAIWLASGCQHSETVSQADQMVDAIQLDMTQDQLVSTYGQPQRKNADPASGFESWAYEPEKGAGIVYVSFNEDKVVAVRSAKLNRTAMDKVKEPGF
jgi:hypothetical protein